MDSKKTVGNTKVTQTKPNMSQAFNNWLDKTNKDTKEWTPVCRLLSDDSAEQSFCLKLAQDYESKKIPEIEFLASLATVTHRSLDEIEKILNDVASGNVQPRRYKIANDDHAWYNPDNDTVYLPDDDGNNWIRLQHELGHRALHHIETKEYWKAAIQEIDAWEWANMQRNDIPKQFIADDLGTYLENISTNLGTEKYHEILQIADDNLGIMSHMNQEYDSQCSMLPPRYADLAGYLDTYPDESFLIEPTNPNDQPGKIDEILEKLKNGVNSVQDSGVFRDFLLTMGKFWDYSIGNQILIMLQKRDATKVAGFNTWKSLGRFVRKGEKGIAILAPCLPPRKEGLVCPLCGKSQFTEQELAEHMRTVHGQQNPHEMVQRAMEQPQTGRTMYFKVVYVFDIRQTDGKPLSQFTVPVLTGEVNKELFNRAKQLCASNHLKLTFEVRPQLGNDVKGSYGGGAIWVKSDEPEAQQLKSLLHEVGHYYTEGLFNIPRSDAETIAESSAFVVGAHYGFDTGERSFPYVAYWARDKGVLEHNLNQIRNVVTVMMRELDIQDISNMAQEIDLRNGYDEMTKLKFGTGLYRKENIVQMRWSDDDVETWASKDDASAKAWYNQMSKTWGVK